MSPEEIARRVIGKIEERDGLWRIIYYGAVLGESPRNIFASPFMEISKEEVDCFFEFQRRLVTELIKEILTECANAIKETEPDTDMRKRIISGIARHFSMPSL